MTRRVMQTPKTRQRPRLRITSMLIWGPERSDSGWSERLSGSLRAGCGTGGAAGIATLGTGPRSDFAANSDDRGSGRGWASAVDPATAGAGTAAEAGTPAV